MNYVISDIHGHYDLFREMLDQIHLTEEDTLYVIGDMIDRGSEPIKVLRYIMSQPNMQVVLGNHENLMLNVINNPEDEKMLEAWYRNGGEVTNNQFKALNAQEQESIRVYLEGLPLYIELENYLLVHAGVRVESENATWESIKAQQIKRDLTFIRDEFIQHPALVDKKVIFGHTQTLGFGTPGEIWFGTDKIGIDCGVYSQEKGGRLGCLNLDTLETYYR